MDRVSAAAVRAWIKDGNELALLDAREEGEFGTAHPFWAVPCALSCAELRLPRLLPWRGTRVVCLDDGRGVAERLAALVEGMGGVDVQVLDGGTAAWEATGSVLFSGVNVPSKAFGEWVEHHYETPSIDAAELRGWLDAGRDVAVLDSRPFDEFHSISIPTGRCVPGGELAYRVGDLVPDPETTIVVNCAGRTRSILGAESLRRAGVPNRVVALRNGTMGWRLAGLDVARGATAGYAPDTPGSAALALGRARTFAAASGVQVIGPDALARLEADPARSLYVLDVRAPEEYRAGHRPGSLSAPGGQLVQATDQWVAVRGARLCLVDDNGVRALMAAAWLRQMGHREVFAAEGALAGTLEVGEPRFPTPPDVPLAGLDAAEGALVVDLARSIEFRNGHVPGAVWGIRTRLGAVRERVATAARVVATSPDGQLARWAVAELQSLTSVPVAALDGGTAAWRDAGRQLAASPGEPPDEACVDFYLRPYDRNSGIEAAMRAYLDWEVDLPGEVARDGQARFGA